MTDRAYTDAGIATPSDADVLAGRGNACNFHPGNEYFRSLVRKHKVAYVACPKPQKAKFSRLIVDEIYARNGRFLKQDSTTKLWHDIGDKKALDKTRQALREGAPTLLKELHPKDATEDGAAVRPPSSAGQNGVPYDTAGLSNERLAAGLVDPSPPPPPSAPLSMHAPSSTPVIQNRRRMEPNTARRMDASPAPAADYTTSGDGSTLHAPSLTTLPAHLVANAHRQTNQEMNALHKKLAALYSPEQFEPTPINPNHQLSMRENARLDSPSSNHKSNSKALSPTRHERSDSLEFDKIFQPQESKSPKPAAYKTSGTVDDLSNQLSNMSFSVGDIAAIQDEGNLSSLFDESMKLKERSSSSAESNNKASNNKQQQQQLPLNMSSLGPTDMSMSTLGGDSLANLQSMNMSTASFTHVFDESTDKV